MPANRVNADSMLCARCLSVFQVQQEPEFLTDQSIPTVKTTVAHHDSESSFREAAESNCFVCHRLDTWLPVDGVFQDRPVTRARLVKTGDGEYSFAIYQIAGPGDQLGRVAYFNAAQVSDSMSLNVPASRHKELIRNWVSECQTGAGSHAVCQHSRVAHQAVRAARRLRRVIQLTTDKTSGDILFRLQDLQAADEAAFDAPYATVSHHDSSYQQHQSSTADLGDDLSNWRTVAHLPSWLQQAAVALTASSVSYLWDPTLCSRHEGDEDKGSADSAEIYSGGVFNIAHLAGPKASREGSLDINRRERGHEDAIPILSPSWAPQHLLALYQNTMFRDAVVNSPLWAAPLFHQALLIAPATLFVVDGEHGHQHLWWHCADGALYSDAIATGVPIGDSGNNDGRPDDSDSPRIRVLGTHTLDIQALLAQFFYPEEQTAQRYMSPAERLAALWTSVAMPYSQIEVDEETETEAEKRLDILHDTADFLRRLTLNLTKSDNNNDRDNTRTAMSTYAYGAWSGGLVYQLAWHGDALRQEQLPQRPRNGLPSWSWMSFHGPIVFEFLLLSGAVGLMVPYLDSVRAHVVPTATAAFEPNHEDNDVNGSPPTQIRARGRLLEAVMDVYDETGGLLLAGGTGHAAVYFDSAEEEDRVLPSKGEDRGQVAGGYVAWPLFTQAQDDGRVESRGLVLREVLTGQHVDLPTLPRFVRCGWFQYSSTDQEQTEGGLPKDLLDLGEENVFKEFLIV